MAASDDVGSDDPTLPCEQDSFCSTESGQIATLIAKLHSKSDVEQSRNESPAPSSLTFCRPNIDDGEADAHAFEFSYASSLHMKGKVTEDCDDSAQNDQALEALPISSSLEIDDQRTISPPSAKNIDHPVKEDYARRWTPSSGPALFRNASLCVHPERPTLEQSVENSPIHASSKARSIDQMNRLPSPHFDAVQSRSSAPNASPRVTKRSFLSRHANSEMNQSLQIIAHTWTKLQGSLEGHYSDLELKLHDANLKIEESDLLLYDLQHREKQHESMIKAQHDQLEHFKARIRTFTVFVQDLGSDINGLRKEADAQRRLLEDHQDNKAARDKHVSLLMAHYSVRSSDAMSLVRESFAVVSKMRQQVHEFQIQAEFLLVQVEETSGLLAEARDGLATLRNQRSEYFSRLQQLHTFEDHADVAKKVETLEAKLILKEKECYEAQEKHKEFCEERDMLHADNNILRNTNSDLVSRCDTLQQQLLGIEDVQAKSTMKVLAEQKANLDNETKKAKAEYEEMEQKCRTVSAENALLRANLHAATIESNEIKLEGTRFRAEVDQTWQAEASRHQDQIKQLQSAFEMSILQGLQADRNVQHLCKQLEAAELSVAELQRRQPAAMVTFIDKGVDPIQPLHETLANDVVPTTPLLDHQRASPRSTSAEGRRNSPAISNATTVSKSVGRRTGIRSRARTRNATRATRSIGQNYDERFSQELRSSRR